MKVAFSQVYIELGANFPFSVHFQRLLTKEVTALVQPSPKFIESYGDVSELGFNVSAKHYLKENEVRGPTVFKKSKAVEYTVFLPFDVIMTHADAPKHALIFLLKGVCDVFDMLDIDKTKLLDKQGSLIDAICSDPTMLDKPSWNEAENKTPVRIAFTEFFGKNRTASG
jgi:hypothetical protein